MQLCIYSEPKQLIEPAFAGVEITVKPVIAIAERRSFSILFDPILASKADRMLLLKDGITAASDIRSAWGDGTGGEEE